MIALLYDVHGNLPALEAVLADARERGATSGSIGGDVAVFGAWPAETIGRLRELPSGALAARQRRALVRATPPTRPSR